MANLEITFCGVKFRNPLVLASGILGITGDSLKYVIQCGAGGVTSKSIWLKGHKGHPNPVIIANEFYMLNAVGVPDAGIEKAKEELGDFLKTCDSPLIANIIASRKTDYGLIAEEVSKIKPHLIEINISCPNVEDEFGRPFACSCVDAAEVTKEVRKMTKLPISVKLSPNVSNIADIAKSVESAGADAITAINTVGPGMEINIEMRAPVLANKVGGLSGPAIKPIAIKAVHDIYKAVKIPIIGLGGVMNGRDAIAMMMAGARLVGMGTAVYYRGPEVFGLVAKEMEEWLDKEGVKSVEEIVGVVGK
ncbi:MAG: dihydroorotate dehydrogenase, dihydroorotate dehydrogenase (fumarate) [Candidatus Peregrinibacteria bacterium GW2011_GWF2_33_10]|nr:MAG: dihydroorotate dehydrogenase, dihydroorotate dehydrogenase (fumarate) [Candidatus Peregrinibacteria bacterium GW2011_GWF2_33_10]OGJ44999.1 MAG: dihydroorotate dehydrogenase B catalytic subunit [Candidatus Peregrinibacteria bacterium RIFOXYA2_FULL_33_21]